MTFRVVCISRTSGAGGEAIAQAIAQQLTFRYVDEEIISLAARRAQVDPALVAKAEHRQPLLQRLLEKIPRGGEVASLASGIAGVPLGPSGSASGAHRVDPADLRAMIQATIHAVADAGQAVIVAHAASMALAKADGVLRVLITASVATRVRRLAERERLVAEEAERRIADSDRERRNYFERFYKLQEELATHYDLVINTDVLSTPQAVSVVLAAAQA